MSTIQHYDDNYDYNCDWWMIEVMVNDRNDGERVTTIDESKGINSCDLFLDDNL